MTCSLIVNADDFGRTPGVSAGILDAHANGIVTTTTALINIPGAAAAVRRALEETPRLGIGLHLNLTAGAPCAPAQLVPDLVDNSGGFFRPDVLRSRIGDLDSSQVKTEWFAQLRALTDTGVTVDHLDSHHHLAALAPGLWQICLELAFECGCRVRAPCPIDEADQTLLEDAPPDGQAFARQEAARRAQASGVGASPQLITRFYGRAATQSVLSEILKELPQGVSELMCHPGYFDPALEAASSYARERQIELDVLTSSTVRAQIDTSGIRLCTFRTAWEQVD